MAANPRYEEQPDFARPHWRRKSRDSAPVAVMHSEMEIILKRLRRVGRIDMWTILFAGAAQTLFGAVAGALVADVGWTVAVKIAFVVAICSSVAFLAVRDTHADSITAIAEDYETLLDSMEYDEGDV